MKIRMNKAHYPVHGLGPGRRIGLWLQGCSIRCEGCVSQDTWGTREDTAVEVKAVVAWCMSHLQTGVDGITISGGEPFDQPVALRRLVLELRDLRQASGLAFDLICYTGYEYSAVASNHGDILGLLDAIITEPYDKDRPTDKYLCGSDNQVLHCLSDLGQARYALADSGPDGAKHMDVCVSDASVWFAGIPRANDLAKLRAAVEARGVKLEKLSWRS